MERMEEKNSSGANAANQSDKVGKDNSFPTAKNIGQLNGDGQEYSPEQLNELREYLSMIADLVIEIYYDEQN